MISFSVRADHWELETGRDKNTDITETSRCYKSPLITLENWVPDIVVSFLFNTIADTYVHPVIQLNSNANFPELA